MTTTIRGHLCSCSVFAKHPGGTVDVEVIACETCPGLVGQCFRISGLAR